MTAEPPARPSESRPSLPGFGPDRDESDALGPMSTSICKVLDDPREVSASEADNGVGRSVEIVDGLLAEVGL